MATPIVRREDQPCAGCGGRPAVFERLSTGELLCAICTAVDAGELLPQTPAEDRVVETLVRWVSAPRRLLSRLGGRK